MPKVAVITPCLGHAAAAVISLVFGWRASPKLDSEGKAPGKESSCWPECSKVMLQVQASQNELDKLST